MTKLTLEQQELLFANDCKLINLRYEYHGYTGTEKWAIVTELAEEELWVKYPDVIRRYTPFILLSMAQGEVITEYQNYEARERMRRLLFGHAFDILKVSRTTVYELLKSKKFHSVRVGGQYRISKKSFENWLNGEEGGSEDGIC